MLRLKQLFKLKTEGKSQRTIATLLCINRETVQRYLGQATLRSLSFSILAECTEEELQELFNSLPLINHKDANRKQILIEWFPYVEKELSRTGVDRQLIWNEYKAEHADGYCYNHFCREYKHWRKMKDVAGILKHKAGEKLYVDYAGKKFFLTNKDTGEVRAVEAFVAILGFSQFTYVEATLSQKREDFITACENALHTIGGVPQAIVCDNLKSAVFKANKYEPVLNEAFERFALHYSTTILPTRPRKPKDKSPVEVAVKIVYKRIHALLRNRVFFTLSDLNEAIHDLLIDYNAHVSKCAIDTRRNLLDMVESKELKTLPESKYEMYHYIWATVQRNSHIMLPEDKHLYSVPFELLGKKVKVIYNNQKVEIYFHMKRVALHIRDYKPRERTTVEEHLPANIQFVNKVNANMLIDWASSIGECTKELVTIIIDNNNHFEWASKSCLGILQMNKKVGKHRLENACKRALFFGKHGYRTIKNILQQNLDLQPLTTEIEFDNYLIGDHENIRGKDYYK